MAHHLAEVNIARMIEPIGHPKNYEFFAALDAVNAEAEASPGFVWRMKDDSGNATNIQGFEWDRHDASAVIVNLTLWESLEALTDYIYNGGHIHVMKKRRKWFQPVDAATTALWWIPAGTIPTVEEAEAKIRHLRAHGESREAFTFRFSFPPPSDRMEP